MRGVLIGDNKDDIAPATQSVSGAANYSVTASSDYFGRALAKNVTFGSNSIVTDFGYKNLPGARTTDQIATLTNKINGTTLQNYVYSYDTKGNIVAIADGGNMTSYVYDEAGQLIGENDKVFVYDKGGNLVDKDGVVFEYDAVWKDKLTKVGDDEIEYDLLGNPTQIGEDIALTWNGRKLMNYDGISYTYDENGLRTSKTLDNGTKTEYTWVNGELVGQKTGVEVIKFSKIGLNINGAQYFYVKNLQGDVVQVVDSSGEVVASYSYDAWGAVISSTGELADVNPIRYRGYYYDNETGLYYLQQRYYNAEWCRFLNADTLFTVGDPTDNNLFAYCSNNPIYYVDAEGTYKISEGKTRSQIEKDAEPVVEKWLNSLGDKYAPKLTESEKVLFNDAFALGLFELLRDEMKRSNVATITWGDYGYARIPDIGFVLTISDQLMMVDIGVAEDVKDEITLFSNELRNHFLDWAKGAGGYALNLFPVIVPLMSGESAGTGSKMYDAIYYLSTIDWLAVGEGLVAVPEDFGSAKGDIQYSLRLHFNNILRMAPDLVIWMNYKDIYGETTKKLWKGI